LPGAVKEEIRSRSREDVAWLNETFGLDLYPDVFAGPFPKDAREEPADASASVLSDAAVDGIAEVLGDLVAQKAFDRALQQGKAALARGDLERAGRMLKRASQLDPEAPQPRRLLRRLSRERRGESADARRDGPGRV
jgi:hypothetical protein